MKRSAASFLCALSVTCAACGGGPTALIDDGDGSANDSGSPPDDGSRSSAGDTGADAALGAGDAGGDTAQGPGADANQGDDAPQGDDATVDGSGPDAEQGLSDTGADGYVDGSPVGDSSTLDSSTPDDSSTLDGSAPEDSAAPDDASTPDDAGVDSSTSDMDASSPDTATGDDAAPESDASSEVDGGVDAGFDAAPPPAESLTVTTSGFGIVTSSPGSLSCPTSCATTFPQGTSVTLTATPSANQTFSHWSGACSGASPTCDVTVNAATTVNAEFSATYPSSATPVSETYACTATTPLGDESLSLTVTFAGAPPTNVPPGATFSMAQFQVVGDVPATFTSAVTQYGYTSVSGQATTIDVGSNDASNKTINAAATTPNSYKFGPIALTTGNGFTLAFPATAATIGTWTAPSAGRAISFTPGEVVVNFAFAGGEFGTVNSTVTCPAPTPAVTFATTSVP